MSCKNCRENIYKGLMIGVIITTLICIGVTKAGWIYNYVGEHCTKELCVSLGEELISVDIIKEVIFVTCTGDIVVTVDVT